jgi:hypothetical protein
MRITGLPLGQSFSALQRHIVNMLNGACILSGKSSPGGNLIYKELTPTFIRRRIAFLSEYRI